MATLPNARIFSPFPIQSRRVEILDIHKAQGGAAGLSVDRSRNGLQNFQLQMLKASGHPRQK
jgi:hypothetical protein